MTLKATLEGMTVVEVNERSANWRLFGGGGLALAGVALVIAAIAGAVGAFDAWFWITIIGVLLIGVALFFVAFGQTGSNGAVGASALGKAALVVAGAAAIVYAVLGILNFFAISTPVLLSQIFLIVFVLFLLISAAVIFNRGVAKGIAKWILFVPVVLGIIWVIDAFVGFNASGFPWVSLLFGIGILLTGVFYLFNKVDVGK